MEFTVKPSDASIIRGCVYISLDIESELEGKVEICLSLNNDELKNALEAKYGDKISKKLDKIAANERDREEAETA